jgi:hypothetical protein
MRDRNCRRSVWHGHLVLFETPAPLLIAAVRHGGSPHGRTALPPASPRSPRR